MGMTRNLVLSDTDYVQVAARFKTEPNPRFRERLHCLLLKDQGYTNLDIASILMVCKETITAWLDTFEQEGLEALCRMEAGGSDAYLSAEQIKALTKELDKHTFHSAKQVAAWVEEQFGVLYSERGMQELLKRLGYTRQKARLLPSQANTEAQAIFFRGVRNG
jgi:transposase